MNRLRAAWRELFPDNTPEPWMFGIEMTVDGKPVPGAPRVGTFTPLGRIPARTPRATRPATAATIAKDGLTMSDDLAEFLLARLDEAEAAWKDGAGLVTQTNFAAMSRTMLVDIDAKRRIVEAHRPLTSYPVGVLDEDGALTDIPEGSFDAIVHTQHGCPTCAPIYSRDPCDTLRALAAPYAGHPDFDPAWRL